MAPDNKSDNLSNPQDENTCSTCLSKECFGTTGDKKHKHKLSYKWIDCDICQKWYHGTCQGLQVADVNMITKLSEQGVRWYCDKCLPTLSAPTTAYETTTFKTLKCLESMISKIDEKVSKFQEESTASIVKIESSWADIAKKNQGEIAKQVNKAVAVSSTTQALITKNIENMENESRMLNAILYGLPESEASVMNQIDELMTKEIFKSHSKPIQATRLGRKTSEKARPIKVRFSDEKSKWDFLKRVNSSLRSENIFCKLDLCQQTREKEFALREQIRTLKQDSGNDGTSYRVRNQVIQEKKNETGEWSNLMPVNANHSTV